jgi:hypothetical protein
MIVAEGIPWQCAMPSPNGEVTRVVMLSTKEHGEWAIAAGLELPGTGRIGVCRREDRMSLPGETAGRSRLTDRQLHSSFPASLAHFLPDCLSLKRLISFVVGWSEPRRVQRSSVAKLAPSQCLRRQ